MITIYDDACLRCDSPNITLTIKEDGVVVYKCFECGNVWDSEEDVAY